MSDDLRPLRIGGITIDFPIVLAPLAGYSDLAYRLICRSLGAPYCATEAMLDRQMLLTGALRNRLARLDAADHPVAGQIMGSDPRTMAEAGRVLGETGFDVIDLNFACPVRKVLARKRGGWLMSRPELALEIVQAVVASVPDRPVTVKLRRAFHASDTKDDAFWTIAHGAFEAGVAAVCVHARTVDQKYAGRADWEFLTRVKREFPERTIIGSGDALAAADALRMIRETGVDGVSVARGAIGNPWYFRQARDIAAGRAPRHPDPAEQGEVIARHYAIACELYGRERGLRMIRNFGIHYAKVHPQSSAARKAVLAVKTEADWRAFLKAMYGVSLLAEPALRIA